MRLNLTIFKSVSGMSAGTIGPDLVAGLMLAAIAIPEQIATARLGNFTPEAGLLAFVVATVAFAAFGASRFISVGADSTITPIFLAGLLAIAQPDPNAYALLAAALALLVGICLIAAGFLRLGWIANLLSVPVTIGFLAGISIHIAVSQLPTALGIPEAHGNLLDRMSGLLRQGSHFKPATLALALGVFVITVSAERVSSRMPGALVGLVLAAFAAFLLNGHGADVEMLGRVAPLVVTVNTSLPPAADLVRLVPLALILTLVIMMQSAATSRSFPSTGNSPAEFDRDLVGVGAANILAAIAGAFPVNASPPRTAVAADSGAKSQLCGLTAAATIALLALFGSAVLAHIPSAGLAGVLLFVSYRILRVGTMLTVWNQSRGEFALIAATILAMVVFPIEIGVGLGILVSLLHGMWTYTRTRLIELDNVPGTTVWWPPEEGAPGRRLDSVAVVAFQAPLSFLNAEEFRAGFAELLAKEGTRLVILEASSIVEIDFTAAQVLKDTIRQCHEKGLTFAVARLESVRARQALIRFGVMEVLGAKNLFRSVDDAISVLLPGAAPE